LGITGLTLEHRDQLTYRADVGGGLIEHERVDIFLCELEERIEVAPNPDEVMDTAWVDIRELTVLVQKAPENYTPWLRIYLTEHAARIFGEND
ncbi:MAG: isopentenyl-diphosphate delta-isomerase, partial [Pseudomonadota bacterium]|nr:isopentenyl-diphosphate delta-isomerase [Pseudomonadota bacterium]